MADRDSNADIRPERDARDKHVAELVAKLERQVAQFASSGDGDLRESDITDLRDALDGKRVYLQHMLKKSTPYEDFVAITTSLFGADHERANDTLVRWSDHLRECRVDRTAETAVRIHFLIQQARDALPEIEAARHERQAQDLSGD